MPSTARSRSASSMTTIAFLPPSSRRGGWAEAAPPPAAVVVRWVDRFVTIAGGLGKPLPPRAPHGPGAPAFRPGGARPKGKELRAAPGGGPMPPLLVGRLRRRD